HARPGWTHEYLFQGGGANVGYGSVAVSGPWQGKPTVYEYFVLPPYRSRMFDWFIRLLTASGSTMIETQSNDPLLTVMLHTFAQNVTSESILFHDKLTTTHRPAGAVFRRASPDDAAQIAQQELDSQAKWVVAAGGIIAAAGDILF